MFFHYDANEIRNQFSGFTILTMANCSLRILVMLKMQFVVEMGITLMGIVYGLVVNLALFIYLDYSLFSV